MGKIQCISHKDLTPQILKNSQLTDTVLAVHYPTNQYLPDNVLIEKLGISDLKNVVIHQDNRGLSFSEFAQIFVERDRHMKFL